MIDVIKDVKNTDLLVVFKRLEGDRFKYPWKQIDIGEGFLARGTDKELASLQSQASTRGKELEKRFITRRVVGGLVVVRME